MGGQAKLSLRYAGGLAKLMYVSRREMCIICCCFCFEATCRDGTLHE